MAIGLSGSGGELNTNPNGFLGGQRSDTVITTDILENLFDNVKRNEILVGRTEYRCIYVHNVSGGTKTGVILEVKINPSVTRMSMGLDSAGKGDGRTTGIATTISTEDTTPTGVKFFGEDILSDDGPFDTVKLPIGLLRDGEGVAVWLKRVTESGVQQIITLTVDIVHDAVTLPGEDVDDGGAIGELIKITKQATGTFLIGTAKIGVSDIAPS